MPVTDESKVNMHARRVLSKIDLKERFLEYLEDSMRRYSKVMFTGPSPITDPDVGGWFTTVSVTDGAGADHLDFSGADGGLYGSDGQGYVISVDTGDSRINEVPFEDSNGVTYYMGAKTCERPVGISVDVQGGGVYYDRYQQEMGHRAEPSAVIAAGAGIALTLGNHKLHASDIFTGRTAIVFLKNPQSTNAAVAIEVVTITGTTATTVAALGQTVVSTTASDYEVIILGPLITRLTTLASTVGVSYIGTVVGGPSPRTFDFSGQPQFVPLGDLSAQANRLLSKGWVDAPTVATGGGGANISVTSTGLVFVNGRMRATATSSAFSGLAVSSHLWLSYDQGTASFAIFSTWDAANAANRVPLVWMMTDGAGVILIHKVIGRSVEEFPDTNTITVGTSTTHHAMFTTLESALAYALSLQKGSSQPARGLVIEILGDVSVSAAISDARYFELEWVTIRGRCGRPETAGSRLLWSHDGGLFELTSASHNMLGWSFEDLVFAYDSTATTGEAAVIRNTGGQAKTIRFRRCIVDGNPAGAAAFGGEGGSLPCMLYNESTNGGFNDIELHECVVLTTDAMIHNDAAGDPIESLKVYDCEYVAAGTAIGAVEGWIVDRASAGGQANWRIRSCDVTARGACVSAYEVHSLFVTDCTFETNADAPVLDLGNSTGFGSNRIWVHDNELKQNYAGGSASTPAIRLRAADNGSDPAGIFIHSNLINGDGSATTATGIGVRVDATDLRGLVIHSNVIEDVESGLVMESSGAGLIQAPIVMGNAIIAGTTAINVDDTNRLQLIGNFLDGAGVIDDDNHILIGNYLTGALTAFGSGQTDIALVGNRFDSNAALTFQHTRGSIVGNIFDSSSFDLGASSTDVAAVGNHFVDTAPGNAGTDNVLANNT